ncbi:MAG: helix-turn-helix domain-containing protein [Clostridiales bacterium]|nr:helix-turn-helix domain-containing protein [Clostridiales bacterium]
MVFHEKIRRVRRTAGISKEQLSERADISIDVLSQLESGEIEPEKADVSKLAKALGVSAKRLLDDSVNEAPRAAKKRAGKLITLSWIFIGVGIAAVIAAFIAAAAIPAQKPIPSIAMPVIEDGVISMPKDSVGVAGYMETRGDIRSFLSTYNLNEAFIACLALLLIGSVIVIADRLKRS